MTATLETLRTTGEDPVARVLLAEAEYETPAPAGGPGGVRPHWGEKAL